MIFVILFQIKLGIITKINVQNGTAIVKIGDLVKTGQMLVEGKIQGKYTDVIYVNSSAEIEAKVWYSKKREEAFKQTLEEYTGEEENKYGVKFNNFQINFYKSLSKFENYDTISVEENLNFFSNFYLPIKIKKINNKEKRKIDVIYTEEELKNKIIKEIEQELNYEIGDNKNIINKYINYKKTELGIELELVYEVLENIGTKEKLND